jgi:hypothetical protein
MGTPGDRVVHYRGRFSPPRGSRKVAFSCSTCACSAADEPRVCSSLGILQTGKLTLIGAIWFQGFPSPRLRNAGVIWCGRAVSLAGLTSRKILNLPIYLFTVAPGDRSPYLHPLTPVDSLFHTPPLISTSQFHYQNTSCFSQITFLKTYFVRRTDTNAANSL